MRPLHSGILFVLAAGAAITAIAEVSDKTASIADHWSIAIPMAAALFVAGSARWWLGAVLAVVPIFFFVGSLDLTFDEYIGPALWREQGWSYFASLWGSEIVMIAALAFGIRRGRMLRDRNLERRSVGRHRKESSP